MITTIGITLLFIVIAVFCYVGLTILAKYLDN